jgi:hypothetical protein
MEVEKRRSSAKQRGTCHLGFPGKLPTLAVPPTASSEVFMREVDDALRQDQAERFLRRYGKLVLAAIVLALLAFAGYLYWQHRQNAATEKGAEQLVLALDDLDAGKVADAQKKLAPLAAGSDGNAALAQIAQAGIAAEQGRADEAAKLYAAVARNDDAPQPLRDLAAVREVAAGFDKLPPQTVIDRLSGLAKPGTPWFGVAGEMVGIAYLKQGKAAQAGPLLVKIAKDKTQPEGLRTRVRQLAGQIGFDAIDDVVPASGEGDAAAPAASGE